MSQRAQARSRIRNKQFISISSNYVYHIVVDGCYYIGQTSQKDLTRIEQHFRGAYYKERHKDGYAPTLYDRMRQYRMQDIQVEIFPGPDYGIPNFNQVFSDFQKEWVDLKGAQIVPLDFAEIYHILWYGGKQNKKLFNTELGGRLVKSLTYNLPTINNSKSILTSKTPIKEAYTIVMHGGLSFAQVQKLTEELYELIFSSQWPNNITTSTLVPANTIVPSHIQTKWADYVKNSLMPYMLNPDTINQYLLSNLTHSHEKVFQLAKTHIWDNFLRPREDWIKNNILKQDAFAKAKINFSDGNFDLSPLTDYIGEIVKRLIYESFDKKTNQYVVKLRQGPSQQKTINTLANLIPTRISVVWNVKGVKAQPNAGSWLSQAPSNPMYLPENWYKHRSLLFFNWIFWQVNRNLPPLLPYVIPNTNNKNSSSGKSSSLYKILGKPIVCMNDVMSGDTLSAAMRLKYGEYAPAYTRSWLEFYRPMVSAWRYATKKEQMTGLSLLSNEKTYWFYENASINAFLVYKAKNFDIISRESDLKIY